MNRLYQISIMLDNKIKESFIGIGVTEIIFYFLILSVIVLSLKTYGYFTLYNIIRFLIQAIVGGSIIILISDGFKYSELTIIRKIQRFSLWLIFLLIISYTIISIFCYAVDTIFLSNIESVLYKLIDIFIPTAECSGEEISKNTSESSSLTNNSNVTNKPNNNVYNVTESVKVQNNNNGTSTVSATVDNKAIADVASSIKQVANTMENVNKNLHNFATEIASGIGTAGAAGAMGIKYFSASGAPLGRRTAGAVATAGATAAAITAGIQVGHATFRHRAQLEQYREQSGTYKDINSTPTSTPDSDPHQSLTGIDFNFGFSDTMTPIEVLVHAYYIISFSMLVLTLLLIYLYLANKFREYNLYSRISSKILPDKIRLYLDKLYSKGNKVSERFIVYIFMINTLLMIIFILLNIYISSELNSNLEDYIRLYILEKNMKGTIPIIFTLKNKIPMLRIVKFSRSFHSSSNNNNHPIQELEQTKNKMIKNTNLTEVGNALLNKNGIHYWKEFTLETPGGFLTGNLIGYFTKRFFVEIINPCFNQYKNITYCAIFKVVFKDGSVRCISNLVVVTRKTSVNNLIKIFTDYWHLRGENYHLQELKKIFISYRTFHVNDVSKKEKFQNNLLNLNGKEILDKNFEYTGYNLPSTTDLSKWGIQLRQKEGESQLISPVGRSKSNNILYNIFSYKNKNTIQVFSGDRLMLEFEDFLTEGEKNLGTFKRVMKNATIYYKNGIKVKEIINRKLKFINSISKDLYLNENFITLDIETRNVDGELFPICISIFDGNEKQSFYISDYNSEFEMIKAAFNFLNKRKYHYNRVYVHNLSKFDGVFLLKYLSEIGSVKPLMRNQSLYELKIRLFNDNKQKYIIILRDSYLILPSSLSKLSKAFQISNPKTIFPIFAVNDMPLDYIGILPNIKYFLSKEDYFNYIKQIEGNVKNWDLRKELIKYCENDVISLHQVIKKFSFEIFDMYRIDIHKYLTLSSIAFAIYRSNYLKNNQSIPKISGQMFKDIYQSYKGGLVDMFIPEGSNLFSFDVNSEYPEAMCKDMPGGYTQYIQGDISLKDPNIFGFYKAEIIAPENLDMPVLPVKYKGSTICALGTWTDWYFTEELRDAEKYGYKIKLIQGYNFQRKNLFKNFVEDLYLIKEETPKINPRYTIIKFILNMTYGRFGMRPDKEETVLVSKEKAINYLLDSNKDVIEHFVFENNSEFIRYNQIVSEEKSDNNFNIPSVSISIASAVVAYGRIKINMLKHLNNVKTYYSDTDSVFTDKVLPKDLVGSKLGQLKLENNIKFGYFIAPKVYCIVTQDNRTICKVKGLKANMSFYEFNMILYKNTTITKYQEKWYRKWEEGKIYIRNEIYSLIVTDNKRQLIYDSCSKLVSTRPFIYINGEIVNKDIGYTLNIKAPKTN